jgi:oligopeptidase B
MKKSHSRHLEVGSNPGEIIGRYYYTTSSEFPYTIERTDVKTQSKEKVFSLTDISDIKKLNEKSRNSINPPVIRISDDETKIIALVDILSNDRPCLYVKDVVKQKVSVKNTQETIPLASSAAWNKEGTGFYYTVPDAANRPYIVFSTQIYFHKLGTRPESDRKILEEPDEAFYLEMNETKDKKYTIMYSMSRVSSEVTVMDRLSGIMWKVIAKRPNTRYFLEHNRGFFYVITNHNSPEFRLVKFAAKSNVSQGEMVLQGDFLIDEVDMYEYHIIIYCRQKGIPVVKVYDLTTGQCEDLVLPYKDAAFSIQPGSNLDYLAKQFTVIYSSPTVYEDTLTYNFESKELKVTNRKRIIGAPLRLSNLSTTRIEAPSHDGLLIPMTLFHHKSLQKDRKNRVLLKGYGAYGQKSDHSFKYSEILAAEAGWIIANAHVRGEGEYGMSWHRAGTKENKANSFLDLISCAGCLIQAGFTTQALLAGYGTSAGGLLMAQAMNMQPGLFAAMVLEVPFVDPLSEMMNEELPLSVTDRDEWGDPLAVRSI